MKKIFSFMTLLAAVISFTACSDDVDYTPSEAYVLEVTKANVSFGPDAATGEIVVNSNQAVKASSTEDWCTVNVNGNTVEVSVTDCTDICARNAEIIIESGMKSITVPVHQNGIVFILDAGSGFSFSNSAGAQQASLKTNAKLTFSTSADWISVNVTEDNLEVSVTENTTGHMRSGYVYYQKGDMKGAIRVAQCDFDTDILGKTFFFAGYDLYEEEDVLIAELATFKKGTTNGSYVLNFPDYGWNIPVTLASDAEARLKMSNNIGTFSPYVVGFTGVDLEEGMLTYSSSVTVSVNFYYDEEYDLTMAEIVDNGSWSGYYISAVSFSAFYGTSYLGDLEGFIQPFLQEYPISSSAVSMRAMKQKELKLNTSPFKVVQ